MKTAYLSLQHRFGALFLVASVACLAWMTTASWGDDPASQTTASEQGWMGILPERSPNELSIEELEKITAALPASWKDWGKETTDLILDFYEMEYPTVEEQRATLDLLKIKLNTMKSTLADEAGTYRNFPEIRGPINNLYGRLVARVNLIESILETLTVDPQVARAQRLAPAYSGLQSALSDLKSALLSKGLSGGDAWLPWVQYDELSAIAQNRDESSSAMESLSKVRGKLVARESYTEDVKAFVSRPEFLGLETAIANLLQTANLGTEQASAEFRMLLKDLVSATEAFFEEPTSESAEKIRRLDQAIRKTAPDGGERILSSLREHWFNYNLRVLASEGLFKRFISDTQQETSWINECIMGAQVAGHQCTNANVTVDLQPHIHGARMVLNLSGSISSSANAYTQPATIQTVGNHRFSATKAVTFDGENFLTEPSRVWAAANNQTVGATTKYSRIPIIGRIADNIAFNEAQSRQGEANALTIRKITDEVGSRLNSEVDTQFSNASMELQNKTYGPLRKNGLYPQNISVSSSNTDMTIRSRLMEQAEIAGSKPAPGYAVPADGALIQMHESLFSNGAQRLGLDGKTMTEEEVRQHLESKFSEILGREIDLPEPKPTEEGGPPQNNTLVFAEKDAIRFRFNNGEVHIIIRAGLKREGGDDIPTHVIDVPLKFTPAGEEVKVTRAAEVAVKAAPGGPRVSTAETVARSNVMRQTIQSALGDSTFKNSYDVKVESRTLQLKIETIEAESGWLTITVR